MEYLIGGTRMYYSIPAYALLSIGSILTLLSIRRVKSLPRLSCMLSSGFCFSYLLLRCYYSPNDYLARSDCYTIFGCLMVYLLTVFYLYQNRPRLIFVFFLLGMALLNVGVGVIQFAKPEDNFMLQGIVRVGAGTRASGLFICPNHFAGYLEAMAVMGLSLVWWSRLKLWLKLIVLYTSGCCYVGVALSGSRGGYFSSIISLLMFLLLSLNGVRILDRKKFIRLAFIMSLLFGLFLAGTLFLMGNSPYLQQRLNNIVADDWRHYVWQGALDEFQTSPLVGTGVGTHLYFARLFRRPQVQTNPFHAHNDYLELLGEYGLLGLVAILVFIAIHIRNGCNAYSWLFRKHLLNSYSPRSDTLALNIGALSAITALAFHSIVDFNLHIPGNALVFAFIFGLIANPGIENSDSLFASKISGLFRFALPLLGVWIAIIAIPKWPTEHFLGVTARYLEHWKCEEAIKAGNIGLGRIAPSAVWPESAIKQLGADSRNSNLYFYLGESYRVACKAITDPVLKTQSLNQSVDVFYKGLKLFPQDKGSLICLGQALDALKRYDEAEIIFQRTLAYDPKSSIIYGYYGTHLLAMGKLDEAEAAYKKGESLSGIPIQNLGREDLGL